MALLNQPPPRSVALELVDGAPAPPGTHAAIIYQVIDQFGVERPKFQSPGETEIVDLTTFVFASKLPDGRVVYAATMPMRISGHTKGNLYKFLTTLMGKAPSYGWDYAELQGSGCVIAVEHKPARNGSRTFVSVSSAGPLPPGYPPPNIPAPPRSVAAPQAPLAPSLPPLKTPVPLVPPAPVLAPLTPAPALVPAAPTVADDPDADDDVPF